MKGTKLQIENRPIEALKPYGRNPRTHSAAQVVQIANSIREFGFIVPALIDGAGGIIAGHGRYEAAKLLELETVPCVVADHLSERQKRAFVIADNKLNDQSGWDLELLSAELGDLAELDFDLGLTGFDEQELDGLLKQDMSILPEGFGEPAPINTATSNGTGPAGETEPAGRQSKPGALREDFLIPPFSTFNARDAWWQERKRAWLSLGIQSEVGRGEVQKNMSSAYKLQASASSNNTKNRDEIDVPTWATTSVFDPVLCELMYRWFCPADGTVIDPFAGGSVRGVVASMLGRLYRGVELRGEQVEANNRQGAALCDEPAPVWVQGDSAAIQEFISEPGDFLFSCPPYANLEVYSDEPGDISNMAYSDFLPAYRRIIKNSAALLKENRFACFVVGEVRNKDGAYYNFVGDTVDAFRAAGLEYYNEAILLTMYGTVPVRARPGFQISRKLGKCHQNVLIFCKGDPRKAAEACGIVDVSDPAEMFGEVVE